MKKGKKMLLEMKINLSLSRQKTTQKMQEAQMQSIRNPNEKTKKKWREEEVEKHIFRLKKAQNSEDPLTREKGCRQEAKRSFTERMRDRRKE